MIAKLAAFAALIALLALTACGSPQPTPEAPPANTVSITPDTPSISDSSNPANPQPPASDSSDPTADSSDLRNNQPSSSPRQTIPDPTKPADPESSGNKPPPGDGAIPNKEAPKDPLEPTQEAPAVPTEPEPAPPVGGNAEHTIKVQQNIGQSNPQGDAEPRELRLALLKPLEHELYGIDIFEERPPYIAQIREAGITYDFDFLFPSLALATATDDELKDSKVKAVGIGDESHAPTPWKFVLYKGNLKIKDRWNLSRGTGSIPKESPQHFLLYPIGTEGRGHIQDFQERMRETLREALGDEESMPDEPRVFWEFPDAEAPVIDLHLVWKSEEDVKYIFSTRISFNRGPEKNKNWINDYGPEITDNVRDFPFIARDHDYEEEWSGTYSVLWSHMDYYPDCLHEAIITIEGNSDRIKGLPSPEDRCQ